MTTLTELEIFLVTVLPSLVAIGTILTATATIFKALGKLKDNESLKAERDALVEQNKLLVAEVRKSRKIMQLYIQKATKIVYDDITEVKNDEDLQN